MPKQILSNTPTEEELFEDGGESINPCHWDIEPM
jgi:hypothetical protein